MPDNFRDEFTARFPGRPVTGEGRRIWVEVDAEKAADALAFLQETGFARFCTLTALDTGEAIEVLYHLWGRGALCTLRVKLDRTSPSLPSAVRLFPAAALYEREARDLLGVEFPGHPDPRTLILPEDWPDGEHPLRKDWAAAPGGERRG